MESKHKKKIYLYYQFERFWHWAQAALIFLLIVTGFEIHSTFHLFGYDTAVRWHNTAGWLLIGLIITAIFWHIVTGQWKNYVPTTKKLWEQVLYYLFGIFRNAPHPTHKTITSKLNPLQRIVYLGLKVVILPAMVLSGLLYMFYRFPQGSRIASFSIGGIELETIAVIHTAGAFLVVAFVIIHLYLISTGSTPGSNLKAMITGWEDLEEEEAHEAEDHKKKEKKEIQH
ncbi:MAG: cytochrome B [Bacteroidetes bacterium]|nr:MAG: cytochrome B [Bacteroidota bacterium]